MMADSVIEDSDYFPGKDDLKWGYEEGKNIVILYLKKSSFCSFCSHSKISVSLLVFVTVCYVN